MRTDALIYDPFVGAQGFKDAWLLGLYVDMYILFFILLTAWSESETKWKHTKKNKHTFFLGGNTCSFFKK